MPRKTDLDFKEFVAVFGNHIDARLKTFEVNIKSYIDDRSGKSEKKME